MKGTVIPSQYLQIALDLAQRIAKGELPEGSRIYGRSVMASEYNVSPETIRRALRLLADMKVVEVKPQSGAVVLSADSARRYIENFDEGTGVQSLRLQLKELMASGVWTSTCWEVHRSQTSRSQQQTRRMQAFMVTDSWGIISMGIPSIYKSVYPMLCAGREEGAPLPRRQVTGRISR